MGKRLEWGLFIGRLILGIIFLAHGIQKIGAMEASIGMFEKIGLPPQVAYLITGLETIAGIFLILGLFVEIIGAILAIEMIVAILIAKLPLGVTFLNGYELNVSLIGLSVVLAGAGSQLFSLQRLLFNKEETTVITNKRSA